MQEVERKHRRSALGELLKHPGWEVLVGRILGVPGQEVSLVGDLAVERDSRLRANDLPGARGKSESIEILKKLFEGEMVADWVNEI